ncbi:GTPase-associated system all-helical protein GASH [Sulfitobacter sp. SK011]|uniref:GTPase-associated system all-helical protein GASH n=1 Tax=Sulfitobacter sp. SK011 TaxID=1389004 RepID=UPI000E0C12FA|nr:GTPase-associated system all-helical protein GASH [Sulfitobacter sp. SK011]AXI42583.1 hypothetical protein C1J02_11995 [Sulfitobacter sp. SK011]
MYDIAEHIRIFEANPSDDFVTKREAAIKTVISKLRKSVSFDELLELADDISTCLFDLKIAESSVCDQVIEALKSKSSSFSAKENELQIAVCAALAVLKLIQDSPAASGRVTTIVFLSFALWSALSDRKPIKDEKLEKLRLEVLDSARDLTLRSANSGRVRAKIPDLKWPSEAVAGEDDTRAQDFDAAAKSAIGALETNSSLDREELDLLWWVLGSWSGIAKSRLDSLSELNRALISGVELSKLLRRVPGDAHRHLVLRGVREDKEFTLNEVLTELGELKQALAQGVNASDLIEENAAALPLLNAICVSPEGSIFGNRKLKVSDWGARALMEAALIRMVQLTASAK